MDAVLSARSAMAWLLEDSIPKAIVTLEVIKPVTSSVEQVVLWMAELKDCVFLERSTAEQVQQRLRTECAVEEAFQMFLILASENLERSIRIDIARDLGAILVGTPELSERLNAVFFSKPMPGSVDFTSLVGICTEAGTPALTRFLERLQGNQPLIREVFNAWQQLPLHLFGDEVACDAAFDQFRSAGCFARLVENLETHADVSTFLVTQLSRTEVKAVRGHRNILLTWVGPFRRTAPLEKADKQVEEAPAAPANPLVGLAERIKRRFGSAHNLFQEIERRKSLVREHLRLGHEDTALSHARRLVLFQGEFSRTEDAVRSLCDLATDAKEKRLLPLAESLIRLAIEGKPDDAWAWRQLSDVLNCRGQFNEALTASEHAIKLDHGNVICKNARAEVLRELNRPQEALEAYDQTIVQHPDDVFARCGRAEVLRELNRLQEALEAYDQTIIRHPDEVVPKSGRAEVLRELNRLREALEAYDKAIAQHPDEVIPKSGRAEVLRELNRPQEALEAYDQTIVQHPDDDVAKCGRATVLMALGRYEDALKQLPVTNPCSRQDWVCYHLKGMIHLRMGNWEFAKDNFMRGVAANLRAAQADYYVTALALCELRQRHWQNSLKLLDRVTVPKLQAPANVIRAHIFGACSRRHECGTSLAKLVHISTRRVQTVAEEIRHRFLEGAPRHSENWLFIHEEDLLVAA